MSRRGAIGKWVLVSKIAEGAYAHVHRGVDPTTGERVALKQINKVKFIGNEKLAHEVRREIALLKLLDHPNIINLITTVETTYFIYIVMEDAVGGELLDLVTQCEDDHLSLGDCKALFG
jgi:serine/threonine protein kinase